MSRVTKQQLILPTILVLAGIEKIYDDYNIKFSGLSTRVARDAVISGIKDKLGDEDLEKLKSRNDIRINQTFRNLISHKDLIKNDIKIQFMILDTLDVMLQTFIKGMLKSGEISDKYFGRAEVYPRITEYIQKIKEHGTSVIIPAQENNKDYETDLLIVSNFKGHINPVVDGVFYLKATESDNRILYLKPTTGIFIKPPTVAKEKFNEIPDKLENPTWTDIMEAIK